MGSTNMTEGWKNETFGCFDDVQTCAFGYCCGVCMYCDNVKRLDLSLGKYIALLCCCSPCALGMLRKDTREKYNIEGDDKEDCLLGWFCGACVNCQIAKEIKSRGN